MAIVIAQERPDAEEVRALIDELQGYLAPLYPQSSQHGLSVERLVAERVAFFVARCDGAAAACGGLKSYAPEYAEVKRMYVRPAFRGLGLAKQILQRLEEEARRQGISVLRLETGIFQPEAIGLYERVGFQRRGPFGEYEEDPLNRFYEKHLTEKRV